MLRIDYVNDERENAMKEFTVARQKPLKKY